jgi:hypothetical protein
MKISRRVLISIIQLALAMSMLTAPATVISLATAGSAAAASTTSTIPLGGHGGHGGHSGDSGHNGGGSAGAHIGATGTYGRNHYESWMYGPGTVVVPHVDTTVHQSR